MTKKDQAKYKISPKGKRKLDFPKKNKSSIKLPLTGKTLYLDVKDVKCTRRLQADLKKLGGTIEEFLSKDINYLITCQQRPTVKRNRDDLSPTPSPFNCDPSPSPGGGDDNRPSTTTRGKAIAERARIQTKTTSTVLDNAEKWGIKIITVEAAFKYINKELQKLPKSPQKTKTNENKTKASVSHYKTFKAPFVKFEALTHAYKPHTSQLEAWPRLNVDTPRGSCPFDGTLIAQDKSREERGDILAAQVDVSTPDTPQEEKDDIVSGARTHKSVDKSAKKSESDIFASSRLLTAGELRRQKALKRRQERKRGYCECCRVQYEDLYKHCRDDQHRDYVRDKTHFEKLDLLIKTVPCPATFLQKEKFKLLETLNHQRKTKREEEDEIVLIPVTPNEKVKRLGKDVKVSPKPSKSPATTTGKSPRDRNKSNLTQDLRKMTPNGKPLMKIVKSPKQMILVSPKKNSPLKKNYKSQDESPGIKGNKRNVAKHLDTDFRRSPRKSAVTTYGISPIKAKASPAKNQIKNVAEELEINVRRSPRKNSKMENIDSLKKAVLTQAVNQVKVVDKEENCVRSPRKNSSGKFYSPTKKVSSPAKSIMNKVDKNLEIAVGSPRKRGLPGKCASPSKEGPLLADSCNKNISRVENDCKEAMKTLDDHKALPRDETVPIQPAKDIIKSPLRTTKSSRTIESLKVKQSSQKSADDIISKSPLKNNTKSYPAEDQLVIKEQPKPLRKSPRKSVQNQNMKNLTAPMSCEETNMAYKSPVKQQLKATSYETSSGKKSIQSPRKSPTKGSSAHNKARKIINYDIGEIDSKGEDDKTGGVEVKTAAIDDRTVGQSSRNSEEMANRQSNKNLISMKESVIDSNKVTDIDASKESPHDASDTYDHDTDCSVSESTDTEADIDSPVDNTRETEVVATTYKMFENHLGLRELIELGAKKAENPTSSDDFERCIMTAISHGDLCHKQMPEDIESDRVLRSKRSLDLDEAEQIQAHTNKDNAVSLNVDSQKEHIVSKAIHDKEETISDSGEQAFTLTEKEIKLFSKPPENNDNGDFELPVEIHHEVFFTPTLAERVKARFRQNSPCSYSLSSPVRSRSNSISSNASETSTARKLETKMKLYKAKKLLQKHVKNQRMSPKLANKKSNSHNSDSYGSKLESDFSENPQTVCNRKTNGNGSEDRNRKHKKAKKIKKISCFSMKPKINSELQGMKDTWNDITSPSLKRSSRSQRRIEQCYNDSSELTEDYEYDQDQSGSGAKSRNNNDNHNDSKAKGRKESDTLNFGKKSTKHSLKTLESIEYQNQKLLNGISDAIQDEELIVRQRLETDFLNKENNENMDMEEDRESPVFNSSPVSKRRKGQKESVSNKISNKNKKEKNEILPLSEKVVNVTVENAEVIKKNSAAEKDSKSHGADCKRKIKISKAIRNSFIENSPSNSYSDMVEVSSNELNNSKENLTGIETAVVRNVPEQSTPDSKKKVPSGCYGSGYSSTPRSERRKAWKRKKNTEKTEDISAKKRRKLDKLKFVIDENQSNINAKSVNDLAKTEIETKASKKKQSSSNETVWIINENEKIVPMHKDRITNAPDNGNEKNKDPNDSFSLQWKSVVKDTVKLNKSWSLLSSRSVNKLLSSEDGRESFDGFTEKDLTGGTSLESDMSYEDCSEVDKSINSDKEFDIDLEEKEENSDNNKVEFDNLLPVFSSPGKKSDSSWFDTCEDYIDQKVKSTVEPLSVFKGWTSPRKASLGAKEIEAMYRSPTKSSKSSRRKIVTGPSAANTVEADREQVDVEIEFNFGSPQKNLKEFSPRGIKKGRHIGSPSPKRKTSTPTRRIKLGKDK